jgi:hypothetical protein
MACKCKQKQQAPVTVMSGGYDSLTTYTVIASSNENEQKKTITSSGVAFIIQRGGNKQTLLPNKFLALKETEVAQLLEQGAPIYVYG